MKLKNKQDCFYIRKRKTKGRRVGEFRGIVNGDIKNPRNIQQSGQSSS
jgi:hypothetical protein